MQLMQHFFYTVIIYIYTYISLKDIVDTVLDTVDAILLNAVFCVWVFDEPQSTLRQPDRGQVEAILASSRGLEMLAFPRRLNY